MIENFDCKRLEWSVFDVETSKPYRRSIDETIETNDYLRKYMQRIGYPMTAPEQTEIEPVTLSGYFVLDAFRRQERIPHISRQTFEITHELFQQAKHDNFSIFINYFHSIFTRNPLYYTCINILDPLSRDRGKAFFLSMILEYELKNENNSLLTFLHDESFL